MTAKVRHHFGDQTFEPAGFGSASDLSVRAAAGIWFCSTPSERCEIHTAPRRIINRDRPERLQNVFLAPPTHLEQTKTHVERLEEIFEEIGEKSSGSPW